MTAEKTFPNHRKVYYYSPRDKHIAYRVLAPGASRALQFMGFDSAEEAEQHFVKNYL
jgi:hypothetical protein